VKTRLLISIALAGALALPAAAQAAVFPTVTTGAATAVTFSGATLHGSVNPRGQATNYYFQYGTSTKYSNQTPLTPVGNGTRTVNVQESITGLSAVTKYHYRLVAVGPGGANQTARGRDRSFTTTKIPLSIGIAGVPNPVVFGSPLMVEGTLSGTGNANRPVILQARPFPYTGPFMNIGDTHLTDAAGGFAFPFLGLIQTAQLQVVTTGKPTVVSPIITEQVAVLVTINVHRTQRRGFAKVTGTVTPPEVGNVVVFQKITRHHGFVSVGTATVHSGTTTTGRFSRVIHVRVPSVYRALVQVVSGAQVSNFSRTVLIK
jgi:hypothetical protein